MDLPGLKLSSFSNDKEFYIEINRSRYPMITLFDGILGKSARVTIDEYGRGEFVRFTGSNGSGSNGSVDNFLSNAQPTANFKDFYAHLMNIVYIDPQRIIVPRVHTNPRRVPSPDGSDLAQVIYTHLNENSKAYADLTQLMKSIFNEIDGIYTVPSGPGMVTLSIRDRFAGTNIPLDKCGTGISQVLHLASMILFSEPGKVFLVDEPHVFLHPGAEKLLAQFIRSQDEHKYVIATHSPLFIRTLSPQKVYLVTRDETGTNARESFSGLESRRLLFDELGMDLGDVSLAEKIIFVEGKTDVEILSTILERTGFSSSNNNYIIISLGESDISRQLGDVLSKLKEIVHLPFLVYLDGDKENGGHVRASIKEKVRYLPEPDIEGVLLRDPEAIVKAFGPICAAQGLQNDTGIELREIEQYIHDIKQENRKAKGSKIMIDLFNILSAKPGLAGLTYRKSYGTEIAKHVSIDKVQDITDEVKSFLEGK